LTAIPNRRIVLRATWTALTNAPAAVAIAASADGAKLVAGAGFCCGPASSAGSFATSVDSGATWAATSLGSAFWNAVACSANGNRLVGANYGDTGFVYTSSDAGVNWAPTSAPSGNWISVASSADGSRLVAAQGGGLYIPGPGFGGPVYTSLDSGASWALNSLPAAFSVASSADGAKLLAAVRGGGIWTLESIRAPVLTLSPAGGNLVLSWTVPSADFVLQDSLDLTTTNWTDVPATPTFDFTKLQNQVTVPSAAGKRFYRLKH
jgi:hypothetical protein